MPQKSSGTGGRGSMLPTPPKAPESLLTGKKKKTTPSGFTQPVGSAIPYAGGTSAGKASSTAADPKKQGGRTSGGGGVSAGSVSNTAINGTGGGSTPGMFTGGSVGAPSVPGAGMGAASAPATGFAAQYTPQALINGLDPNIMAADILGPMGVTNMDIIQALGQLGEYGLLIDFLTGGPADERGGNMLGDAYNNQAGFMQNLVTAGGSMPNANELMDIILNAPPDSYIGQFLLSQGPEGVNQLLEAVMGIGMTPYYRQAAGYALDQELLNQQRAEAKGDLASRDGYYGNLKSNPLFGGYF